MATWDWLSELFSDFEDFRLSKDYVYVAFRTLEALQADFNSESIFNPHQTQSPVSFAHSSLHIQNL